jgi:hypothetical protein|eukprot:SAG25_NODE_3748_length_981_cov_1.243764_1_plen_150_part_00
MALVQSNGSRRRCILRSSGGMRKNWKRRWFVLDASDQTLVYHKAKPQEQGGPKGTVPVEQQVREHCLLACTLLTRSTMSCSDGAASGHHRAGRMCAHVLCFCGGFDCALRCSGQLLCAGISVTDANDATQKQNSFQVNVRYLYSAPHVR